MACPRHDRCSTVAAVQLGRSFCNKRLILLIPASVLAGAHHHASHGPQLWISAVLDPAGVASGSVQHIPVGFSVPPRMYIIIPPRVLGIMQPTSLRPHRKAYFRLSSNGLGDHRNWCARLRCPGAHPHVHRWPYPLNQTSHFHVGEQMVYAVPTALKCSAGSQPCGADSVEFKTPMLWGVRVPIPFQRWRCDRLSFLSQCSGRPAIYHDTNYVVCTLPLRNELGAVFCDLRRYLFYCPRFTGRMYPEWAGNCNFLGDVYVRTLHSSLSTFLGRQGMPRRYIDYPEASLTGTFWSSIRRVPQLCILIILLRCYVLYTDPWRASPTANPWNEYADTLEWTHQARNQSIPSKFFKTGRREQATPVINWHHKKAKGSNGGWGLFFCLRMATPA